MNVWRQAAADHLWMHFSRMGSYAHGGVPTIVRGKGARIWDAAGKQYLDGLAGLFVVQVGHGRVELAEAAYKQATQLGYFPLWSYAHPSAIALAERLADYTPGDLNKVFFTTGGGEAVETAWKLAKQYFKLVGKPMKHKVISRAIAYHGTPQGALALTGIPAPSRCSNRSRRVASGCPTPTSTALQNTATTSKHSDDGPPIASRRRSSSRVRTPSPPFSWSRSRTQAAASRRRPATSSGSARSAIGTTCSSSRTR